MVAPLVLGSAIAAGGSLLGGILGQKGQADANKANKKLTREQMAFQERMSNTAHQRQITDLRKAGLNPILSATSGASTPGGANAQMGNEQAQNALNASSAGQMLAQIQNVKAQTDNIETQTAAKKQDIILKQPAVAAVDSSDISGTITKAGNSAKTALDYHTSGQSLDDAKAIGKHLKQKAGKMLKGYMEFRSEKNPNKR